jgi:hypothetical protein
VKDTSLRVPHGVHGKVIDVKQFRRDDNTDHELPAGVNEMVRVSIAQKRKISEGDKMAGATATRGSSPAYLRSRKCRSCRTGSRSTSSSTRSAFPPG